MGRTYAGILGPVAFCTVVTRGLIAGGDFDSTMLLSSISLFAFAAIGFVVGSIAENTILHSVIARCNAELEALEAEHQANRST